MRRLDVPASNEFFLHLFQAPSALLRGFGHGVDGLLNGLERHRQRQALRGMPDHLLKDMGLSRVDAEREAEKPFWLP